MSNPVLSPKQIENWRRALFGIVGPYAFLMPDSEVEKMRDEMQERFGAITPAPCEQSVSNEASAGENKP